MKKSTLTVLVSTGLATTASAQLAQWSVDFLTDWDAQLQNEGLLVIATNAGADQGAQAVTISGIEFGLDESAMSRITNNAPSYSTGADTADQANLITTGHTVAQWSNDQHLNFGDVFIVGQQYRLQLIIGHRWEGAGVNLYGPNGEYQFSGNGDGDPDTRVKIATFDWIATGAEQPFIVDVGAGQGQVDLLGYSLHLVPAPSGMAVLGIAGLAAVRRRR